MTSRSGNISPRTVGRVLRVALAPVSALCVPVFCVSATCVLLLCAAVPAAEGGPVEVRSDVLRLDASELPVNDHDIAALPDGGWIAVWEEGQISLQADSSRLVARRFDPAGKPVGAGWIIATGLQHASPRVAVTAEGRIFCVAWRAVELRLRCPALDAADAGLAVEETVVREFLSADSAYQGHDVSRREILWGEGDRIRAQPLPQDGGPLPPQRQVARSGDGARFWFPMVADGEPDWQTWEGYTADEATLLLRPGVDLIESMPRPLGEVRLAATGEVGLLTWVRTVQPSGADQVVVQPYFVEVSSLFDHFGPRLVLDERSSIRSATAAYAPSNGREPPYAVVGWQPEAGPLAYRLPVQVVDVTGAPVGFPVPLLEQAPEGSSEERGPIGLELHRLEDGRFLATWTRNYVVPLGGTSSGTESQAESPSPLQARIFAPRPDEVLRLAGSRFAVTVDWTDPYGGGSGSGQVRPLNGDTGAFWFFRPDNLELLVKVLDGRPVNGHWWVFYGGLSTVGLEITVHDWVTDRRVTYRKPPFELASAGDTLAFPEVVAAGGVMDAGSAAPVPRDHPSGTCIGPSPVALPAPGLCLHDRFDVEVQWATAQGTEGAGRGARLTPDSGYLWFFREDNAELLVKVLDGRPVNGHWWVFSGALTNVAYTLVVRDTETGREVTFTNPQGSFGSFADTLAFPE